MLYPLQMVIFHSCVTVYQRGTIRIPIVPHLCLRLPPWPPTRSPRHRRRPHPHSPPRTRRRRASAWKKNWPGIMGPGVVSISIYFMIFPILPPFHTKILPFCGLWEENPTISNTPCLCWKKRRLAFVAMCFIFLTSSLGTTARDGSGARRLFSVISEHPWIMCHGRHGPSITNQPTNQPSKQASKQASCLDDYSTIYLVFKFHFDWFKFQFVDGSIPIW